MKRVCQYALAVMLAFVPAVASADWSWGVDPHPLIGGGSAMVSGSEHFSATLGGINLDVTVDWAVFDSNFYPGIASVPADQYVYAYQIYNNGPTGPVPPLPPGPSNTYLTGLDIGLVPGATVTGTFADAAFDSSLLDIAPGGHWWIPGSVVKFRFLSTRVDPDDFSEVILFTSPYSYTMRQATVFDSGVVNPVGSLPSPIPAPGAALLAVIGLGLVGRVRRGVR